MIEKILLADSGNGQTETMLKFLMELPLIQRTFITILHVVPPQATSEAMAEKWEVGGKLLGQVVESLHLDPRRVTAMLRQGEPKDVVCQVAEELPADLIIMGSRGLKRLQSILENSVSQYVFQLSSRPMLLVKDDIYVRRLKRLMIALDGSTAANDCLNLAIAFLRDMKDGQLILAHINRDLSGKHEEPSPEETRKDPILAPAIAMLKRQGLNYRCIVRSSSRPGQEICQLASDLSVDLLMLGSPDRRPSIAKGLPDLDRLLGTSVSDYVRVNVTCPVLIDRVVA